MEARAAIVTGGSRRIGRSIVEALHGSGIQVLIHCNTSRADAEHLASALNAARPDSARVVCADLSLAGGMTGLLERSRAVVSECVRAFGRCDILVNNASAYVATPLVEQSPAGDADLVRRLDDLLGSNAVAPFCLIRAFAQRHHEAQSSGAAVPAAVNVCVVNLTDAMVHQPLHQFTVYSMAKHALEGLTASAALELAPLHIRVNAVAPGLSALPVGMPAEEGAEYRAKVPLGQREATPEEIAQSVLFLVSAQARYITGTTLKVDGAWSLTRR